MARLRATVISQPPGLSGTPSAGQRSSASASASWAQSSASVQSPVIRISVGDDPRRTPRRPRPRRPAPPRPVGGAVSRSQSANGRSLDAGPPRAIGWARATSIASSRSAHSSRSKPTITSLVSANGPSESSSSPLRTRTVVAADVGASPSPCSRRPLASFSATHTSMSGSVRVSVSGSVSVQTNIRYFIARSSVSGSTTGDERRTAFRTPPAEFFRRKGAFVSLAWKKVALPAPHVA